MTIWDILSRLEGVKSHGDWYEACCPVPEHGDEHASLTVSLGDTGILLNCHADCTFDAICGALQAHPSELFYENSRNGTAPRREIAATYDYTDEEGRLLFQAVRYIPKDFRQRRPGENGDWIWDLKQTRRVLYHLPRLLSAVAKGVTIWIVEGEKDVHALEEMGFAATTNPMGAGKGKWLTTFSDTLAHACVVILPDRDAEGEEHAERIARSLEGTVESVRVIRLPGLPKGGDVSDWIRAGGTKDELVQLARETPVWTRADERDPLMDAMQPPPPADTPELMALPDPYPRTDLGNAHRLVDRHGVNLRWCEAWQTWLIWDGKRWTRDPNLGAERYAHETVEAMYRAAWKIDDTDQQKEFSKFALTSQGGQRIQAMLRCARALQEVAGVPDQFDVNDWTFNVFNGTVDLLNGALLPHRREDYITRLAPVVCDPLEECPLWLSFLNTIFQGNEELIGFLQRACGYALAGTARERCLFVLWGSGDNGKSTFLELLRDLMGDYGHKMPKEVVSEMSRRGGQANPDVAALKGKRFCYFSETTTGGRLSEAFIKELTGNEAIWARDVYEKGFNFVPQFKIFLGTNHKPRIIDPGKAFWNRVRLIPFTYSIPKAEQDPGFKDRLWEERSGILNWMLAGAREWLANGLQVPAIVEAATAQYREEQDTLGQFVAECCVADPLGQMKTRQKEVYDRYVAWCSENHESFVMKSREFRDRMIDRGFRCDVSTGGFPYLFGIGLQVDNNRGDLFS